MKFKSRSEGKSAGRKGGTAGPGKRWGHTCNSVKNGRALYVFGGYGKDNKQTNDVHIFDTGMLFFVLLGYNLMFHPQFLVFPCSL